jgi:hypothetical protein
LHDIEREIEADDFPPSPLTKEQLFEGTKYSQWVNGPHWYAKLPDGRDVEADGKCKWDSRKEAVAATRRFLKLKDKA